MECMRDGFLSRRGIVLNGVQLDRVQKITVLMFDSNVQEYTMATMRRNLLDYYSS